MNTILNNKGKRSLAYYIAVIEIMIHAYLATIFVGWESNFPFYSMALLLAIIFISPSQLRGRVVWGILTTLTNAGLYFFCRMYQPLYRVDSLVLTAIGVINAVTIYIVIIIGCYFYVKTTDKLKADSNFSEKLLGSLKEVSESIITNAGKLEQTSYNISNSIIESGKSMENICNSIDNIDKATQNNIINVDNITKANRESLCQDSIILEKGASIKEEGKAVLDAANKGGEIIFESVNSIKELENNYKKIVFQIEDIKASSEKLQDIFSIITSISSSIKLLSINASIEAVKAGGHSNGFLVIASEIRKPAEKTTEYSKDINSILTDFKTKSDNLLLSGHENIEVVNISVNKVIQADSRYKSILASVGSSQENIGEISEASVKHTLISENITDAITKTSISSNDIALSVSDISKAVKYQLDVLNELEVSCIHLHNMSEELSKKVAETESLFIEQK